MNMKILEKMRILVFIAILGLSIHLPLSYSTSEIKSSHSQMLASVGFFTDYFSRACGKWDKPEDCWPLGMTYYRHPVKGCQSFGFCDCFQRRRRDDSCENPYGRMEIYMPEKNRCYPIFTQGPCKASEWLIFDKQKLTGKCVGNPCFRQVTKSNVELKFWFYDSRIGRCHQALTQGYCPKGKKLLLVHSSPFPQCIEFKNRKCAYAGVSVIGSLECRPGTRYSHFLKQCRSSGPSAIIG